MLLQAVGALFGDALPVIALALVALGAQAFLADAAFLLLAPQALDPFAAGAAAITVVDVTRIRQGAAVHACARVLACALLLQCFALGGLVSCSLVLIGQFPLSFAQFGLPPRSRTAVDAAVVAIAPFRLLFAQALQTFLLRIAAIVGLLAYGPSLRIVTALELFAADALALGHPLLGSLPCFGLLPLQLLALHLLTPDRLPCLGLLALHALLFIAALFLLPLQLLALHLLTPDRLPCLGLLAMRALLFVAALFLLPLQLLTLRLLAPDGLPRFGLLALHALLFIATLFLLPLKLLALRLLTLRGLSRFGLLPLHGLPRLRLPASGCLALFGLLASGCLALFGLLASGCLALFGLLAPLLRLGAGIVADLFAVVALTRVLCRCGRSRAQCEHDCQQCGPERISARGNHGATCVVHAECVGLGIVGTACSEPILRSPNCV